MQITFPRIAKMAAAVTIGLGAVAAQAGTMTYNGAYYGNFNNVSVTAPAPVSGYTGGPAGGFSVTLSLFGDAAFDGKTFEAYCVDLAEYIGTDNGYSLLTGASYFSSPTKVNALSKLIRYVKGTNVFGAAADDDKQSTALQLAIWNIVYDIDLTLSAGSFLETSSNYRASVAGQYMGANDLLSNSQSYADGPNVALYVLASGKPLNLQGSKQDQLIWLVPEPGSLALAGLALVGVAASRRRKA